MRRLLAVWAHPDDEAFGPVGTMALARDHGYATAVITATRGDAGNPEEANLQPDETLGDVRERELRTSTDLLGVEQLHVWQYGDGKLYDVHPDELAAKVVQVMLQWQPEVVITFGPDGITGHSDHVAISAATARAYHAYARTTDEKPRLLYVTVDPEADPVEKMAEAPAPFKPNVMLDVSAYADTKRQALEAHASQRADWEPQLERPRWLTTDFFYQAYPAHTANTVMTTLLNDDRT